MRLLSCLLCRHAARSRHCYSGSSFPAFMPNAPVRLMRAYYIYVARLFNATLFTLYDAASRNATSCQRASRTYFLVTFSIDGFSNNYFARMPSPPPPPPREALSYQYSRRIYCIHARRIYECHRAGSTPRVSRVRH